MNQKMENQKLLKKLMKNMNFSWKRCPAKFAWKNSTMSIQKQRSFHADTNPASTACLFFLTRSAQPAELSSRLKTSTNSTSKTSFCINFKLIHVSDLLSSRNKK